MHSPSWIAALAALSVASLSSAANGAKTYSAACVFDQAQCGGLIKLRHYQAEDTCQQTTCAPVPLVGTTDKFSVIVMCVDDIAADAAAMLGDQPYVLMSEYSGAGCTGKVDEAYAVVADGECHPSDDGDSSYKVQIEADQSIKWSKYDDAGDCTGMANHTTIAADEADGTACVMNEYKVLLKAGGSTKGSMADAKGSMTDDQNASPKDDTKNAQKDTKGQNEQNDQSNAPAPTQTSGAHGITSTQLTLGTLGLACAWSLVPAASN